MRNDEGISSTIIYFICIYMISNSKNAQIFTMIITEHVVFQQYLIKPKKKC